MDGLFFVVIVELNLGNIIFKVVKYYFNIIV